MRNFIQFFHLKGDLLLRQQFGHSKLREKATIFTFISAQAVIVMSFLMRMILRNEKFTPYQYIANERHWWTMILAFLVYTAYETVLMMDFAITIMMSFFTLYICCVTMNFWLQKIWYEDFMRNIYNIVASCIWLTLKYITPILILLAWNGRKQNLQRLTEAWCTTMASIFSATTSMLVLENL